MQTIIYSINPTFAMELHLEFQNELGGTAIATTLDYDGNETPDPAFGLVVSGVNADGQQLAHLMFQASEYNGSVRPEFSCRDHSLTTTEKSAWLAYAGFDTAEEAILDFGNDYRGDMSFEDALNAYFDDELALALSCGPLSKAYHQEYKRQVELWHIERELYEEAAHD